MVAGDGDTVITTTVVVGVVTVVGEHAGIGLSERVGGRTRTGQRGGAIAVVGRGKMGNRRVAGPGAAGQGG